MEALREEVINLNDLRERKKNNSSNKSINNYELKEELKNSVKKMELLQQMESIICELTDITILDEENENKVLNPENMDIIDSEVRRIKEECDMKLTKIKKINKINIEFITVSFLTIVISLIGLLIFAINGFYIIHPIIYVLGIFMGIGWGATALTSIYFNRR